MQIFWYGGYGHGKIPPAGGEARRAARLTGCRVLLSCFTADRWCTSAAPLPLGRAGGKGRREGPSRALSLPLVCRVPDRLSVYWVGCCACVPAAGVAGRLGRVAAAVIGKPGGSRCPAAPLMPIREGESGVEGMQGGPRGLGGEGQRRRGDCAETGVGWAVAAGCGSLYAVGSSSDRPDVDGWVVSPVVVSPSLYNGAAPAPTVEWL